jgi:phosphoribosylformylglycinamidine synthase subunit PurL
MVEMAKNQEITLIQIGVTQSDYLDIDEMNISVKELTNINNNWFANYNSK